VVAPDPRHFAPLNGLLTQVGSAGTLIGPPVFAAWSETAGWDWGAVPVVVSSIGGVACLLAVRRILAGPPAVSDGPSRSPSTG
jgi:MFS family permease